MSTEAQTPPPQHQQINQYISPPTSFRGTEFLPLLEVSQGRELSTENPHFFLTSALLPLAQLNGAGRMLVVWISLAETEHLKRLGLDGGLMTVRYDEYLAMAVCQSSRAEGGAERKALMTSRQEIVDSSGQPQRKGLLGLLSDAFRR